MRRALLVTFGAALGILAGFAAGWHAGRLAECNDHAAYVRNVVNAAGHVVDICR